LDLFINKGINENKFSSKDSQVINMFVEETAIVVDTWRIDADPIPFLPLFLPLLSLPVAIFIRHEG